MTRFISTDKVTKFARENPDHWFEGLDKQDARRIRGFVESRVLGCLWGKFYWKKAKSYVFNDRLSGRCYCITKKYYDSLSAKEGRCPEKI